MRGITLISRTWAATLTSTVRWRRDLCKESFGGLDLRESTLAA